VSTIKLNYGFNTTYYDFNPGTIEPSKPDSAINFRQLDKKYAFEPAIYFEAEQILTDRLAINYGLRYSMFNRLGSSTVNLYANNQPVSYDSDLKIYEKAKPIGSTYYSKNSSIANFNNFEPRFSAAYELNKNQSVNTPAAINASITFLFMSNSSNSTAIIKPRLLTALILE